MKKEIKKQTNNNVYPTIKKISLAMTIICWVSFGLTVIGGVLWILTDGVPQSIGQYVTIGGGIVMVLSLFLAIGQIVLAKKVTNVTPKLTSKKSKIAFAIGFAVAMAAVVAAAIVFLLAIEHVIELKGEMGAIVFCSLGGIAIIGFLLIAIMSTIIVAQIKVKKPVKKGK